jgi:hypothetical protein
MYVNGEIVTDIEKGSKLHHVNVLNHVAEIGKGDCKPYFWNIA